MKKNNLIMIIIVVLIILGVIGIIVFKKDNKKDDNSSTDIQSSNASEVSCRYDTGELEARALSYFTRINGFEADNGEPYQAGSIIVDSNIIIIEINHLETDHVTIDTRYEVDCNTGIATDEENNIINLISD